MSIFSAPRFGAGIGLHRVDALLVALGIDRSWLTRSAIAVTGSNGKGSTAALCSSIAVGHGLRTGLFTSPHLYRFNERVRIDGADIDDRALSEGVERVLTAAHRYRQEHPQEQFAAFELVFALAIDTFARSNCEVCVYEAGIGGRFDPVRLVGARTGAVTSLDLEHTALLGGSLELICYDKSDICGPGSTIFYGSSCLPLAERIDAYCRLRPVRPVILGRDAHVEVESVSASGTRFSLSRDRVGSIQGETTLIGAHQAENAAIALQLFEEWSRLAPTRSFNNARALQGMISCRWPGRLETISESPLTVIDVGHTPAGINSALRGLRAAHPNRQFVLVTGISMDKNADEMLGILAPSFDTIVCTQAYYKGRSVADIAAAVRDRAPSASIHVAPNIESALQISRECAVPNGSGIYVAGSMYAAVEYAEVLRGNDPRAIPHLSS